MSAKRSDIEISAALLGVAMNGAKKSHIIYKANLNFKIGKKYLDRLINSGLLWVLKAKTGSFERRKREQTTSTTSKASKST